MSTVSRTAGINGTFSYSLSAVPFAAPVLTIYSNALRTVVAVSPATLAATANPAVFTATYPSTLAAGTYYLSFSTVLTSGQPAQVDADDELVLYVVSGDVSNSYATVAEARSYGISAAEADDATLGAYLSLASSAVNDYCGRTFSSSVSTVVVNDVRSPLVTLPTPFSAVTSVTVNDGTALASTAYVVEPWGVRLYWPGNKDADGFPARTFTSLALSRAPYGAKVSVTATFGFGSVPGPVKEATLTLARHLLTRSSSRPVPSVDAEGNATVLPDAAYTRPLSADAPTTLDSTLDSTGSIDADRLLRPYRRVLVG